MREAKESRNPELTTVAFTLDNLWGKYPMAATEYFPANMGVVKLPLRNRGGALRPSVPCPCNCAKRLGEVGPTWVKDLCQSLIGDLSAQWLNVPIARIDLEIKQPGSRMAVFLGANKQGEEPERFSVIP